ncbi:hypothetical protein [Halotia branconii]|uniref:Uncharacterized protein n=1 Tax=Halotia branconii CENA392 TaxID=1539056 RepID=A0AAJ6P9L8_9CYAN|nr:hypothetical protein [Halotia branconii]WGV25871.1 hypothetical protein QI031_29865 [Halotia branconii CENA392]
MQRILSSLKQISRPILVLSLMVFVSLSGLFIFTQLPSYATTLEELKLIPPDYRPTSQEKIDRAYEYNRAAGIREEERQEAYEQAVKDAESLETMEKAYERNLKAERKGNSQPNLLDKAEEIVDKVTGN